MTLEVAFKIHEKIEKQCARCKKTKAITELLDVKDENDDCMLLCCDCLKFDDKKLGWIETAKQCMICRFYQDNWKFVKKTKDGNYETTDECLNCRLYYDNFNNMIKKEKITCSNCENDYTYLDIFKVNGKYRCTSCIEDNIDKGIPSIESLVSYDENGKKCIRCNYKYPEWYCVGSICNSCRYKMKIRKIYFDRKKNDIDIERNSNIPNGGEKIRRSRSNDCMYNRSVINFEDSVEYRESIWYRENIEYKEKVDKIMLGRFPVKYSLKCNIDLLDRYKKMNCYETICKSCSRSISILHVYIYEKNSYCLKCASDIKRKKHIDFINWLGEFKKGASCLTCHKLYPSICFIDDNYHQSLKCLFCRNNEKLSFAVKYYTSRKSNDDVKGVNMKDIYYQYLINSFPVICKKCEKYVEKTSAYGSIRMSDKIEYENGENYYCLKCAIDEKKDDINIIFKRVFDDELNGVRTCNKCNKTYMIWHYIKEEKGSIKLTKNCIECRNLEKVTKSVKKGIFKIFDI